jgi:hypothetical protein
MNSELLISFRRSIVVSDDVFLLPDFARYIVWMRISFMVAVASRSTPEHHKD